MKVKNIYSKEFDTNYLLSKELYNIWKNLNLDISIFRKLKNENNYDYFDIGKIGYISYLPEKRIDIIKEKEIKFFTNNYRQEMKIGRMINPYLKHNLENIVNKFKTEQKILSGNFDMFRIVEGEEIKHWYDGKNYLYGGGQLNNSCMRNVNSDRFNLYSKNPKVCKLLILVDERTNKLMGRALLWKTKDGWYLDRVYTRNDSDMILYNLFAQHKGYSTFGNRDDRNNKMSVQLNYYPSWLGKKNPYMDTFKYFNVINNTLSTKYNLWKKPFRSI